MKAGTLFATDRKNIFALSTRDGESLTGDKHIFVKMSHINHMHGGIYFDLTRVSVIKAEPRISSMLLLVDAEGRSVDCQIDLHSVASVYAQGSDRDIFVQHASQKRNPLDCDLGDFSTNILVGEYGMSNYFVGQVGNLAKYAGMSANKYRELFERAIEAFHLEFDSIYSREFLAMIEVYIRNLDKRCSSVSKAA